MKLRTGISRFKETVPSSIRSKLAWTFGILCIYFALLHLGIFGIPRNSHLMHTDIPIDPIPLFRVITASNFRSIAEFGIIPIVLSIVIFQILIGSKLIKVDFTKKEDRKLYAIGTKVLAIILTIAFALVFSFSNFYGEDLSILSKLLILAQLLAAGLLIILMDELLQRGYGIGSGTSLFILASVCYNIFEGMFSLNQEAIGGFMWYQGSILAFFQGIARGDLQTPFYNPYKQYDFMGFLLLFVVAAIVIYLISIRVEIPAQSKKDDIPTRYPIRSMYTFYVPVILSSVLFAIIYFISNLVTVSFSAGFLGIFFPPTGPGRIVQQPALVIGYIIMMTIFCGIFSRIWTKTARMDSLSVAKQFLSKDLLIPGFREHPKTVQKYLNQYIPASAWLGGFFIGFLASIADFLGPLGTGTGVLVAICIIREYYDVIKQGL
ncbi:MAG: hypothetical protein H7645_11975 [Candidatus Heimdallarchaeota archaeon]|nr:hypothetical protein [Candidatus Heimdallarchaeota archaeon]MCK4771041.1 hypothetical protein [Candidatus Heimdallarchaeota archaeon]